MTKTLTLRFSELATLADCQLKYKLGYAERLIGPDKPRLVLGTAYHKLMEGHYRALRWQDHHGEPRNIDFARKHAVRYLNDYRATGVEHLEDEVMAQLRWMYDGFCDHYGVDPQWGEILVVEERRAVPLVSHLGVRVNLAVTADLVVRHTEWDRVLIVDTKTLSNRDAGKAATAKENQLDLQRGTYAASFSLKGPKAGRIPIFGAAHNTVRTDQLKTRELLPQERFGRHTVYYNSTELEAIWAEVQNLARDAVEIRLGRGRAKRMYSSPDPMTCSWKCQFKEPHLTARATGRDATQVAIDYGFVRAPAGESEFIGDLIDGAK